MKRELFALPIILFTAQSARADFWGGHLPLLAQIVTNTLQTLNQLRSQTSLLNEEMYGVTDRIYRLGTIADVVQPSQWDQWRNPTEALKRLKLIYETMPKEYRSAKSDEIETEIATAMDLVSRVSPGAHSTFLSGKELERRGANSSPAVAEKLTASGVGTLVAVDSQNLVIQSHITSLLAQMLADANEKEARGAISKGQGFLGVSQNLGPDDGRFSSHVFPAGTK